MRPHIDEHVEVTDRYLGRFGLERSVLHTGRLDNSDGQRHRPCVGSTQGRRHTSDEVWRHGRDGVVDHHRSLNPDRKACSEQSGEMDGFLEGAAALCGGGESEQVSNRSRTKDRDPESAHVRVRW